MSASRWLACFLLCALGAASARAPDRRELPPLFYAENGKNAVPLDALVPSGRWLLIVVDAQRAGSVAFLDALQAAGYDGEQALVLVVGHADAVRAFAQNKRRLPQARWLESPFATTLPALDLPGTPAVLGLDAERRIDWQVLGRSAQSAALARRLLDWTGPEREEH